MRLSSPSPAFLVVTWIGALSTNPLCSTTTALQTEITITDATHGSSNTNDSPFLAFENAQELKGAVDLYLDYHVNAPENQRLGVNTLYLEQLDIYGDIANWNVQKVDNFANLFSYKRNALVVNATHLDLSRWNVSNAQYLQDMFLGASKINFDVSLWDVRKAQHFNGMFEKAASFQGWGLEHWNVSQGQLFGSMFSSATSLYPDLDLSSWELKSATDLENMFRDSSYGKTLPGNEDINIAMCAWVQHLDPSVKVTNMFADSQCTTASDPVLTDEFRDIQFCGPCSEWIEE